MWISTLSRRAVCLGLTLAALGCKQTVTVVIEREEIQQRLATKFPLHKPLLLGNVSFENPNVILRDGSDRIAVELDVKLTLPLLPAYSGKLSVSGRPEYRPLQKAFYLREAALERFEVVGLPAAQAEALRGPTELVARAALDSVPVYQFEQKDWKEVSAEHLLKEIKVQGGKLHATLGP